MIAVLRVVFIGALGAVGWIIGTRSITVVDKTVDRAGWLLAGLATVSVIWLVWKGR